MRFFKLSPSGEERLSVVLFRTWGQNYGLSLTKSPMDTTRSTEDEVELLRQAIDHAKTLDAEAIQFRLIETPDSSALAERLPSLAFKKKLDRIEFRSPMENLSDDLDTPFEWVAVAEVGLWSLEELAAFAKSSAVGDPDFDQEENALEWLEDCLEDPVLTHGPHCLEVGFLNGEPAAFVVAQMNPKTGWSRISYMGLLPEFRRRGLGQWVHRHGFAMMRKQGGTLYHGGTTATNTAMIRLFEHHQCIEYRRMEEWIYRF